MDENQVDPNIIAETPVEEQVNIPEEEVVNEPVQDVTEEKKTEVEATPEAESVVEHHVDTDPEFNCPTCYGDGIVGNDRCSQCQGTGKI